MNYTTNFPYQVLSSEATVKTYLISCFKNVISSKTMQEAIIGNLYYEDQRARFDHVMTLMKQTVDGV